MKLNIESLYDRREAGMLSDAELERLLKNGEITKLSYDLLKRLPFPDVEE